MPAERLRRIAFELVAIAPRAPWLLRRAAGMGLDSASGQPLGLDRQQPTTPEGSAMNTATATPKSVAYDGPIIRRGETVRVTSPLGEVTVGRVQRVVLVRGHYDPSVVVMRYLAVEGIGVLVPSTDCEVIA